MLHCILECHLCVSVLWDRLRLLTSVLKGNSTTYRTGEGDPSRNIFLTEGKLDDARFSNDLPIRNESTWFRLSVSKDLGAITPDVSGDALFAIGLVRNPSISFTPSPGGTAVLRKPCFRTAFDDVGAAVSCILTRIRSFSNVAFNISWATSSVTFPLQKTGPLPSMRRSSVPPKRSPRTWQTL